MEMKYGRFSKLSTISLIILLIAQMVLVNTIVQQGYLNSVTQYELHYNPLFEVSINEPNSLPFHVNRYYLGSLGQNNLFMELVETDSGNSSSNTEFWIASIPTTEMEQNKVNILSIPLSKSSEIFSTITNSSRIVGNQSHLWAMSYSSISSENKILILNHNLSILKNGKIYPANLEQDGFHFQRHWDLFYSQDSIWRWDEYEEMDTGQRLHFLSKYNPDDLSLVQTQRLPASIQEKFTSASWLRTFNNRSLWISEGYGYKEYTWSGTLLSELNVFASFELQSLSHDKEWLHGPFITQDAFIFMKETGNPFITGSSDLAGFYIVPFKNAVKPIPVINVGIWIILSSFALILMAKSDRIRSYFYVRKNRIMETRSLNELQEQQSYQEISNEISELVCINCGTKDNYSFIPHPKTQKLELYCKCGTKFNLSVPKSNKD